MYPGECDPSGALDLAARYRMLVEHTPDAIVVHQRGLIVFINSSGLRYLRADSVDRILGRPITDFIAPESIGPMLSRIEALGNQGGASAPSEATVVALDGSTLTMEAVSVRTSWNGEPAFQVIMRDLTEHKAAQDALAHQAALVEHVSDAIIGVSEDGTVSSWNPAAESVYGRAASRVLGGDVSAAVGVPCDPSAILAAGGRVRDTHRRSDGTALAVMVSAAEMDRGFVLVCADQTAVRRAEEHFTAVVESLDRGVVVFDHTGHISSANLAAKTVLDVHVGLATSGPVQSLPFVVHGTDGRPIGPDEHPVALTRLSGEPSTAVIGIERRRDGRKFWLSLTATLLDPGVPTSAIVAAFSDITEQYRAGVELEHAATHDHLTGLPNRTLLLARLDNELARPARRRELAVLYIDLDNFKSINDRHGHAVGDAVLGVVAQRLTDALHENSFVGRIGGDEFVVVVPDGIGDEAHRVRTALSARMSVAGRTLTVEASVGCVLVPPSDDRTALDILNDADLEMYRAKPAQPYGIR